MLYCRKRNFIMVHSSIRKQRISYFYLQTQLAQKNRLFNAVYFGFLSMLPFSSLDHVYTPARQFTRWISVFVYFVINYGYGSWFLWTFSYITIRYGSLFLWTFSYITIRYGSLFLWTFSYITITMYIGY
jgi:hypothetical protein